MNKLEKQQKKALAKEREKHHKDVLAKAKAEKKNEKVCPNDAFISLQHVDKIYPNHVQAVYDFNLDIKEGEFIVFVGPSGCGKSTTLRMIAGLEQITAGDLFIDGVYANEVEPKDRNIGMVFQSYALYPHMSVYENMAFGLRVNHLSHEEIDERIHKAASILQIEEYLDRKPNALSGGQCQRVALGRAIVTNSKVFLMDEPLSNLDAKLRVAMRSEIVKLTRGLKTTTIYVTHDQTEAMTMATRIVVMSKGYVQQIGTPKEIFHSPANMFVATFVGSPAMNMIKGTIKGDSIDLGEIKLSGIKGLNEAADAFYDKEIALVEKSISDWKETYLRREIESPRYIKMWKKGTLDTRPFEKLLGEFGPSVLSEEKKSELMDLASSNPSKEAFEESALPELKELLFAKNALENPEVGQLVKNLDALKAEKESESRHAILGIRPEHIEAHKGEGKGDACLEVSVSELLGSEYYVHLDYADGEIVSKIPADEEIEAGDKVFISIDKKHIHLFDPITRKRISL